MERKTGGVVAAVVALALLMSISVGCGDTSDNCRRLAADDKIL